MAKEPEQIKLTTQEINDLHQRIDDGSLTKEDLQIFKKTLHFIIWVQLKIQKSKMTISNLKKIIFGSSSEKTNKKNSKNDHEDSAENKSPDNISEKNLDEQLEENNDLLNLSSNNQQKNVQKKNIKGHGRNGKDEYIVDEVVNVKHKILKSGDACPTLCGGKLYEILPGGFVQVHGQECAHVVEYIFDKLRCAKCGGLFVADEPENFTKEKYDAKFKAVIVLQKYFLAVPFYRQEQYQAMLNLKLSDATQFDLVEQVANCVYPVNNVLEKLAANGELIHNDDTTVKILEIINLNKKDDSRKRKGTYTTCIFAYSGEYEICLFYSGSKHSGENLTNILKERDKELPPIIQMCDALSANISNEFKTILCNCLAHGRRNFKSIESYFPTECDLVIDKLSLIYKHDKETKEQNMSANERLAYHQKFSKPIMDDLKIWMQKQFDDNLVEPNSALGAAIKYMIRHWDKLTKFLSIAGAPLDNNIVERSLKLAIRVRKNSMFYRTAHGAAIGSILLSLIYTCKLAKINPLNYLTALQKNKSKVFKNPENWLPWNYIKTLDEIACVLPLAA